uniref:CMP/dCMP-type deaminase domain-containing protein n=1 Tax=Nymphaea colorata TaxID=210225 RepID=A0A5K1HQW9_9MAGN|nr:unnamed protein product [Nymphaea colorata]
MCTFALNLMRISMVYFGQFNDKFGGCGSLRSDHKFPIRGGIMEKESLAIIKDFYEKGNQKIPEEMRNRSRKKQKIEGD